MRSAFLRGLQVKKRTHPSATCVYDQALFVFGLLFCVSGWLLSFSQNRGSFDLPHARQFQGARWSSLISRSSRDERQRAALSLCVGSWLSRSCGSPALRDHLQLRVIGATLGPLLCSSCFQQGFWLPLRPRSPGGSAKRLLRVWCYPRLGSWLLGYLWFVSGYGATRSLYGRF